MRAVSVAFSPERPSRLKNEPGILPAEYIRSSTSTVKGRKSTSRRLPTVAVFNTIVSPWRTTTAPEACLAIFPVSKVISDPAISTETVVTASSDICLPSCGPRVGLGGPASVFVSIRAWGSVYRGTQQGRRARHAGPQPLAQVARHPLDDGVGAAIGLEARDVQAQSLAALPQVRVVDVALVG